VSVSTPQVAQVPASQSGQDLRAATSDVEKKIARMTTWVELKTLDDYFETYWTVLKTTEGKLEAKRLHAKISEKMKPLELNEDTQAPAIDPKEGPTIPPVVLSKQDALSRNFQLAEAESAIRAILSTVENIDDATLRAKTDALSRFVQGTRGDRKAARQANGSGLAFLRKGSASAAASLFEQGVGADPVDVEIVNNLAFARHKSGDLPGAKAAAIASVALAPQRANAWAASASVYADMGQRNEAIAAFLLTFRYSKNQQKTIEIMSDLRNDPSVSFEVNDAASAALAKFAKVAVGPDQVGEIQPSGGSVPSSSSRAPLSIDQAIEERRARECTAAFVALICHEVIRWQECSGHWSAAPSSGMSACKGVGDSR
jgi:tetratricopeptide (TPR) repeat protein